MYSYKKIDRNQCPRQVRHSLLSRSGVIVFVVKVARCFSPRPINTGHRTETAVNYP